MPQNDSARHRPVRILPPEVARKIAAGEVIDRPCAIVRELMDNAVDSGADSVQVEVTGGGIDRIRIVDNGGGMTREDLASCAKPHATSKIRSAEDLLGLSTLGFRGEALASIAAVSRLHITSAYGGEAWRLEAYLTDDHVITPANLSRGTIVQAEALFQDFPARRVFLKRPSAETMLCRQTFIEKALPRTDISFRLAVDGKPRLDLPAGQTLPERFTDALDIPEPAALFYELHGASALARGGESPEWRFTLVIGEPSVCRGDRKMIFIYVNGRRVNEYSLMQAVEYGGQGFFPNGTHPVAALFVEMNPALVDFNIHPAKKEARFKDIAPLHHAVSSTARDFFRSRSVVSLAAQAAPSAQGNLYGPEPPLFPSPAYAAGSGAEQDTGTRTRNRVAADGRRSFFSDSYSSGISFAATAEPPYSAGISREAASRKEFPPPGEAECSPSVPPEPSAARASSAACYVGSVLGVFLAAEKDGFLYLIDQHAAHERILYDRFIAASGARQPLLVPYVLETSCGEDDDYLRGILPQLERAGFDARDCGEGRWEFHSVPAQWRGSEEDLAQDLLGRRISPGEVLSSIAATNACRAAVKDGHILDAATASALAGDALALEDPRCPHGRPIWTRLARDDLFRAVRRT